MCEFCIQHGEGKKWYLQAKNYSLELVNEERRRFPTWLFDNFEQWAINEAREVDLAIAEGPSAATRVLTSQAERLKREHWGQVIPLEEIEQILDMTLNVVRFPCLCRSMILGRYDSRYCFGITAFNHELRRLFDSYPDFSAGGLEVLTKEEAKKAIRKLDQMGLVHTVWTMITPFIGGICNCTSKDCLPLKSRVLGRGLAPFKGEWVASIDLESCTGCRDCMRLCNFGAITYSSALRRCFVNQFQCFGCGVCRAVCAADSISLMDRNAIPVLAKEW